ncbi:hypothetical protein CKJ84_08035 [Corynebacterium sp. NML 120412]|uniref:heparinase II/III domain-containing protein n=1 Tax=Corynebacterium sp. NML 120412 TaxID=2029401 RepID=UPI000BAA4896|nr:heparinase II/III family protein [Corynebacterium sp. NML 120412]PAT14688.1 hypothetical protein CKJ84_08035 [Corynebacterium sp. NML 120412]
MDMAKADNRPDYWLKFPDGSPDRWKVERSDSAWSITMPNSATITISSADPVVAFNGNFDADRDSTRLWVNSMRYATSILDEGDEDTTWCLLSQLKNHVAVDPRGPGGEFSGSLDHQYALQLRTLCDLRSWLLKRPWSRLSAERDELLCGSVLSIYKYVDELSLLRPNNHGVMLAISLLHSFYMFNDVSRAKVDREGCIAIDQEGEIGPGAVVTFLNETFKEVFGDDGVANENTPIYQAFYLKLIKSITDFQSWAYGQEDESLGKLNARATTAYRHMLLPNRAVPPLGDGSYSQQSEYSPLFGLWASPENGLLTRSSDETFFSFTCGYRGVFHKQLDDSSIYLWHNGEALIQDAGLKSYDANDPVATSIRGQLGHSGLFFREFDGVRAEKVTAYGAGTRLVEANMEFSNSVVAGAFQVRGRYGFRGVVAERLVTWLDEHSFLIRDSVESTRGEREAVSRFVLDPQAEVTFSREGAISVTMPRARMDISTNGNGGAVELIRGFNPGGGPARGFISPRNYSSQPTTMLEFRIPLVEDPESSTLKGKHLLRVSFGEV